jgi:hypothetical protein
MIVQISTINDGAKEYGMGLKEKWKITKVEADWVEGKFFVTGNRIYRFFQASRNYRWLFFVFQLPKKK